MSGLWRNNEETREGKYLVQRRDGSIPEWPWFVLGAKDPAAGAALLAYAQAAESLGYDDEYVQDVIGMVDEWRVFLEKRGQGDPDAPPHRKDDPETIKKMAQGHSA